MRPSQATYHYRTVLRPVLKHAQPWNEKAKKIALPEPDLRTPAEKLEALAERLRKEGPVPISDRLQAKLRDRHEA